MRAYERLLKYAKVYTTSDPESGTHPSAAREFDLAHLLVEEMKSIGIEDAFVDEHCYVYGSIPATKGCEKKPALGLIAHMDTAPDASGENVKPILHENYDGGDVTLPGTGMVMKTSTFPFLKELKGETLITTDGTISEIPRENYIPAEKRVIDELEALGKPFVILLNSTRPDAPETKVLAAELEQAYGRTVLPVSCLDLQKDDLLSILQRVLYEFPVRELDFAIPRWVTMLEKGHWLQNEIYTAALQFSEKISRMKDVPAQNSAGALAGDSVQESALSGMNLSDGVVRVTVLLKPEVFYRVLSEQTGLEIGDEAGLMPCIIELSRAKREYEKIRSALEQVEATGYGIVMPSIEELSLEEPEIVRQGGRYGVRLEASAPSIHMMKAVIHTEISPIVGTEKQSEDLVQSLLGDFEADPERLWESNIFGKSLHELVNEGLQNKLLHMPQEARTRLQETLEQVINDGCTGLICILL